MHKFLNLVAGIDGTWNDASSNTNVFRLTEDVCANTFYHPGDAEDMCITKVNYERGVGTSPTTHWLDGGFAPQLYGPIGHTYDWLATKLCDRESDYVSRIYIFGFSRGAYCAHVLSWLLQEVGVPTVLKYAKQIAKAYVEKDEDALWNAVQKAKCIPSPRIQMLGLWDVVTAPLDIRQNYHDGLKSPLVDAIYHAMAANETRMFFPVMQYQNPGQQNIHQVWFSGVHGDVGGMQGYESYLSDITLNWMECRAYEEGIGFTRRPSPMTEYDFSGVASGGLGAGEGNRSYLIGEEVDPSLIARAEYDRTYLPNVKDIVV